MYMSFSKHLFISIQVLFELYSQLLSKESRKLKKNTIILFLKHANNRKSYKMAPV